jgi:thioredoxin reductase (NADPH)
VTSAAPLETDALVIGAGPAGLFQVFQLGLLEIKAHVIDALPYAGGQCIELYADKPIYDIPSVKVCTGRDLTDKLLDQIAPFGAKFHFQQVVSEITRQADGRFLVCTDKNTELLTKTIFIAAGIGAFLPKKIKTEGLDAFDGIQLSYHLTEPSRYANQKVVIVGDGDSAVEAALALCAENSDGFSNKAASVTLLHRRDVLSAAPATENRFRELLATGALRFLVGQVSGIRVENGLLTNLRILKPDTTEEFLPTEQVLVLQGLSPKLGAIADWGMAMERRQLVVNTENYATSEPGIFAVGDINTYPGKRKLILCAFHECVLAAYGAAHYMHPEQKPLLEYTTTSTRLHKALGLQ